MNRQVSLLTFHASHNFGSVMQAFALKRTVEMLGNTCEVINFRPVAQLDKYSLLPKGYGAKQFVKSALQLAMHPTLTWRTYNQYESFIANYLTNGQPITHLATLQQSDADVMLAGSDQIWGYQIPEFCQSEEDIRPAYYLSFSNGRKVSYASSTGAATIEQLAPYARYMNSFDRISVRERASVELISRLSNKSVDCVLDPTFLLEKEDYFELISGYQAKTNVASAKYCLIYSLQGFRARNSWMQLVRAIQDKIGLPLVSVSHFVPLRGAGITPIFDIGPTETLNLFANAEYVLTDTFHGTLFSTHFDKQFIVFTPGRDDPRIGDITSRLGLSNRVVRSVEDAACTTRETIDYEAVGKLRTVELGHSISYLQDAIKG